MKYEFLLYSKEDSIGIVTIKREESLNSLNASGFPLITLSTKGRDISSYRFPSAFCLVPGLEGPGLPHHLRDALSLTIPMYYGVESLNAALATGIALYIWRREMMSVQKYAIHAQKEAFVY